MNHIKRVTLLLFLLANSETRATDLTKIAQTKGKDVAEAAIDTIRNSNIFADDNDLLKRIAYIESKYGEDNHTYRHNYFGGIWQLDQIHFNCTKNDHSYPTLRSLYANIIRKFDINWTSVEWTDLEKPFYSCLASRLYLAIIPEPIPETVSAQAIYWKQYYNSDARKTPEMYASAIHDLESTNECRGLVDLMIVMDGSGSIGSKDFLVAQQFVANFTDTFTLEKARIGFHVFSDTSYVIFALENNFTNAEMKQMITNASYPSAGTATDEAILEAILEFNATSKRDGVPQVMAVFTDGKSNNGVSDAVKELQNANIISFAIGIGESIKGSELLEIAGNRTSRVFTLSSFSGLKDFVHRANAETCAQRQMPPINVTTYDRLTQREKRFYEYALPPEGITIVLNNTSGHVMGYYSYTTEKPSSALNDGVISDVAFIPQPNNVANSDLVYQRFKRSAPLIVANNSSLFVTVEGINVNNNYTINTRIGNQIIRDVSVCDNRLVWSPCMCDTNHTIVVCNSTSNYYLRVVFDTVNDKLTENSSNIFSNIVVYDYGNDFLSEDVFGKMAFKNITIFSSNIQNIHSNAFVYTSLFTQSLTITETFLSNNGLAKRNIFESVSKLINLRRLDLSSNRLVSVPDNAFHPILAKQKYLRNISLANNSIKRIGFKAFYGLPAVTNINLSNNCIKQIGAHSFQMSSDTTNSVLVIDLSSNFLESLNFNHNWYSNTLRPLTLILSNNNLQSIPSTIFKVFLNRERENTLIANGNPIICNCSVKWLVEDRKFYSSKVLGVKCEDGRQLFDWDVQDFDCCHTIVSDCVSNPIDVLRYANKESESIQAILLRCGRRVENTDRVISETNPKLLFI